jgi:hypothetical protein
MLESAWPNPFPLDGGQRHHPRTCSGGWEGRSSADLFPGSPCEGGAAAKERFRPAVLIDCAPANNRPKGGVGNHGRGKRPLPRHSASSKLCGGHSARIVGDMRAPLAFTRLVHADWSTSPKKRWSATALRTEAGWHVDQPQGIGDTSAFLARLLASPQPTLAGFDFPIGLPKLYGAMTGFSSFSEALGLFGSGDWSRFYNVAGAPGEVSLHRPFYPKVSSSAARQVHLIAALGVASINQLRRLCERATSVRRAACPLFWTLGGNQVGKAAISGWKEIIIPGRKRGAKLWPFDGSLADLAAARGLVLAETYPAEAYGHVGVTFAPGESKRRQTDRARAMRGLETWAKSNSVSFSTPLAGSIADGFGPNSSGGDAFDALIGLLGMIEIADGRRAEGPLADERILRVWEGWILGQEMPQLAV